MLSTEAWWPRACPFLFSCAVSLALSRNNRGDPTVLDEDAPSVKRLWWPTDGPIGYGKKNGRVERLPFSSDGVDKVVKAALQDVASRVARHALLPTLNL